MRVCLFAWDSRADQNPSWTNSHDAAVMIRSVLTILYTLALALGLGGASAWLVTDHFPGFSNTTIGQWVGYPISGDGRADPYARARAARTSEVPLGAAEGLVLTAMSDQDGQALRGTCAYRLQGRVPPTRVWTLKIVDGDGRPLVSSPDLPTRSHSRSIIREPDGMFSIVLADQAQPGNWLHLDHEGPVSVVLTLYDTTVIASSALFEVALPTVGRIGCRS